MNNENSPCYVARLDRALSGSHGIYGSQSSEGRPHSTAIALAMVPDVSLHYRDSGANIWASVGLVGIIESLALSSQVSRCCTKKKKKKKNITNKRMIS